MQSYENSGAKQKNLFFFLLQRSNFLLYIIFTSFAFAKLLGVKGGVRINKKSPSCQRMTVLLFPSHVGRGTDRGGVSISFTDSMSGIPPQFHRVRAGFTVKCLRMFFLQAYCSRSDFSGMGSRSDLHFYADVGNARQQALVHVVCHTDGHGVAFVHSQCR